MSKATKKEIESSISMLQEYENRLKKEVIEFSKKLKISKKNIEITLESNQELKKIKEAITRLEMERKSCEDQIR